jgi:hypothetical protein
MQKDTVAGHVGAVVAYGQKIRTRLPIGGQTSTIAPSWVCLPLASLGSAIMQGKGIDIHATGLDSAVAEWPLVGAGGDAREHAIRCARKLSSPAAPLLVMSFGCPCTSIHW